MSKLANTFRKIYKKTGSTGSSSDYQLVGNVGVDGVELDIMKGASSSVNGEIGLVPKPISGEEDYVLTGSAEWKELLSILPLVRSGMSILTFCKMNYIQRGVATMRQDINGYFRTNNVSFPIAFKSGTSPTVSVAVVNYQNSNLSSRVHPLVAHVSNTSFDIYVADSEGQLSGNENENAYSVYWIAVGEIV